MIARTSSGEKISAPALAADAPLGGEGEEAAALQHARHVADRARAPFEAAEVLDRATANKTMSNDDIAERERARRPCVMKNEPVAPEGKPREDEASVRTGASPSFAERRLPLLLVEIGAR